MLFYNFAVAPCLACSLSLQPPPPLSPRKQKQLKKRKEEKRKNAIRGRHVQQHCPVPRDAAVARCGKYPSCSRCLELPRLSLQQLQQISPQLLSLHVPHNKICVLSVPAFETKGGCRPGHFYTRVFLCGHSQLELLCCCVHPTPA